MGEPKDDDPLADWDDGAKDVVVPQEEAPPATSRTQTLADPLTTGLLAEVARRTTTMEFDPSTFEARPTKEIDKDVLAAVLHDAAPDTARKAK